MEDSRLDLNWHSQFYSREPTHRFHGQEDKKKRSTVETENALSRKDLGK